jgi:hypothetical protein
MDQADAARFGESDEEGKIKNEAIYQFQRGFKENATANMGRIMEADWGFTPWRLSITPDDDSWFPNVDFDNAYHLAGYTEDQWDAMDGKQRRKVLDKADQIIERRYFDKSVIKNKDNFSMWKLGGMLVDPTTAIPALGSTVKGVAASSAALGGADAALWSYGQEGEVDPLAVGIGTVGGAVVGGGIAKIASKMKGGGSKLDSNIKNIDPADPNAKPIKDEDTLGERVVSKINAIGKGASDVLEPVGDRLKRISPRLAMATDKFFENVFRTTYLNDAKIAPFVKKMTKLRASNKAVYDDVSVALANEDYGTAEAIFRYAGMEGDWKVVKELFEEGAEDLAARGVKPIKNYFPMQVKDFAGLAKEIQKDPTKFNFTTKEAAILTRQMDGKSDAESAKIIENAIRGYNKEINNVRPGHTKSRKIQQRSREMLEFYHRPEHALANWSRKSAEDRALRNFVKAPKDDLSYLTENEDNLTKALNDMLRDQKLTDDQLTEAADLLRLSIMGVHNAPNKVLQKFKVSAQGILLSNPVNAVRQLQDYAFSVRYNTQGSVLHLMEALGKKSPIGSLKGTGLTAREMGLIETITAEMLEEQGPHMLLTKLLKASGFTASDVLGKNVYIKTALRGMVQKVKSEKGIQNLRKKWEPGLGKEATDDMINALKNKDWENPNIRLALFSHLTKVQPTIPTGMPAAYWRNPNLRFMYTLRSFQIKYLNQIKNHVFDTFKASSTPAERAKAVGGLASLVALTTAMGVPVAMLQKSMLGRDYEWEELMVEEGLKATGFLSKYDISAMEKGKETALTDLAVSQLMPPANIYVAPGAVMYGIITGDRPSEWSTRKTLSQVPIVGKLYEAWGVGVPFEPFKEVNKDLRRAADYPPVDVLGAMWGSPNADRPGYELWNRANLKRGYEDVGKEYRNLDYAKEASSWWRDAQK